MTRERPHDDAPVTEEERLQERISALLDGELEADERAAVEAVIAADDTAREIYDDLALIRTTLASLDPVPAPRSFAIPAPAAAAPRGLLARFDFVLRIGSAAAALLFVVAMAGGGSLQTASVPTQDSTMETMASGAGEREALVPAGPALAPAPEPNGALAPGVTGEEDGATPDSAPPADAAGSAERSPADEGPALEPPDGDFRATDFARDGAQSPGGVTAGLGALALLMAALSVLFTWQRRALD